MPTAKQLIERQCCEGVWAGSMEAGDLAEAIKPLIVQADEVIALIRRSTRPGAYSSGLALALTMRGALNQARLSAESLAANLSSYSDTYKY